MQLGKQVIGLLKNAFVKAGLDLFLAPYSVIPTEYECGILEVLDGKWHVWFCIAQDP